MFTTSVVFDKRCVWVRLWCEAFFIFVPLSFLFSFFPFFFLAAGGGGGYGGGGPPPDVFPPTHAGGYGGYGGPPAGMSMRRENEAHYFTQLHSTNAPHHPLS